MKKNYLYPYIFISIFFLGFSSLLNAQISISLNVATPGTLSGLIAADKKDLITDLTLTGQINGEDLLFIREMAGRDSDLLPTSGSLISLNLASVYIVSGGYYATGRVSVANAISAYLFNNSNLVSIVIPNSVTKIGQGAFAMSKSLSTVTMVDSNVKTIDHSAFNNCSSLNEIELPTTLTTIGVNSLSCTGLSSISIPNSVTSIEGTAFWNCTNLTFISIPSSVTSIGDACFSDCTSLESITIPNSISYIPYKAFLNCTKLSSISLPTSVTEIGKQAFSGCTSIITFDIPEKVKYISYNAFEACSNLTLINIPASVTTIRDGAFYDCSKLAIINSKMQTPAPIVESVFTNVNKTTCKLYVPDGTYSTYWVAPVWGDFLNIIEGTGTYIKNSEIDPISIFTVNDGIIINSDKPYFFYIYNIFGQKIFEGVSSQNVHVPLRSGNYLLTINKKTIKVLVK